MQLNGIAYAGTATQSRSAISGNALQRSLHVRSPDTQRYELVWQRAG